MAERPDPYSDTYPEAALSPAERLQFMNRYTVRRADTCISCGLCESLCPYGVHKRIEGHVKILPPDDRRCIGPSCSVNYFFCVANCPTKSLSVVESDNYASMGDARWPVEMIASTWRQAETGRPIALDHPGNVGRSGGGFDRLYFKLPEAKRRFDPERIGTSIQLNRRGSGARIEIPSQRRASQGSVKIQGARENNLADLDVEIPLGVLTAVTGVSGAGKSSLLLDILDWAARQHFHNAGDLPGPHDRITGWERLDGVVTVDQGPIGRTTRSNAATYAEAWGPIREALAATPEARAVGPTAPVRNACSFVMVPTPWVRPRNVSSVVTTLR